MTTDDGDDEHGEAEQQRVDDQHRDERADEDERAADRVDEALGDDGVEQGGVGADAGDEVAGAAACRTR